MSLITRTAKGSKLTIAEMDGNLEFLASSSFQDGVYSQTVIGTGAVLRLSSQSTSDAAVGTYEDISPTGGSGTGLVVDIEIADTGRGLGATYTIVNGGTGYQVGDTVSIQNTDIGGTSGTTDRDLSDGDVDVTTASTITVTNNNITLDTTTLTVTGSMEIDGGITTPSNIQANAGNFTNQIGCGQLSVVNLFGSTNIYFGNLPTTDPQSLGQLWNDSGSLKISAGE